MNEDTGAGAGPLRVASAFAELSAKSAAMANENRTRIAQMNIDAGQAQIDLEATDQRRQLARAFEQHRGATLAMQASARTSEGISAGNVLGTAERTAGEQVAIVEANRAAKEQSLLASQNFMLEDVGLASIRGGLEGYALGQQIQSALDAQTTTDLREGRLVTLKTDPNMLGPGMLSQQKTIQQGDTTFIQTPGFDLANLLGL